MKRSLGLLVACILSTGIYAAEQGTAIVIAQAEQAAPAQQPPPQPTPQQRVGAMVQWLDASQKQLRAYEWIETTIVAIDGEEKSRKQNSCYYGADGKVQKVPIETNEEPKKAPRGPLRRKIAESKKEELTEYMQNAVALVHSYIPPEPGRLQQAVNAGTFEVNMLDPGRKVQLQFNNYQKTGDMIAIDVELPTNRLLGMHVASYLDTPDDAVKLDVVMGVLPDGTINTSRTTLAAPAEDMVVTVENTGYRHSTQ